MDGDVLSLSSSSSSAAEETQKCVLPKSNSSLAQNQQEHKAAEELWTQDVSPVGDRLRSTEEQFTLITESMTVTSTDEEKLLLLNKNTELRRVNKELMKLNEDWDQVYRSTTRNLQQRNEALEVENAALNQLNSRLLLKVEHEQSAKEYYEQTLTQELKKNQELQGYVRLLESRTHHPDMDCTPAKQAIHLSPDSVSAETRGPDLCASSNPPGGANLSPGHMSGYSHSSSFSSASSTPEAGQRGKRQGSSIQKAVLGESQHDVQDLKEQLETLRCQTQIYEAEYETEHNDHKHTLHENRRLKKKREEMCQQVALLQEQLKVYEDDFRRERSDKQMLQRLLLRQTPQKKDPVLVHRCNNQQQPVEEDKRTESGEKRKQDRPFCPKHSNRDK